MKTISLEKELSVEYTKLMSQKPVIKIQEQLTTKNKNWPEKNK